MAVRRLAAENIPLYTFTFGKSGGSERADLAIDDLVTNETIFAETPTEVRGQLTAEGYANQQVKVQLLWETAGKEWKSSTRCRSIPASKAARCRSCCGTRRATPGEYKVTLRVEPREGELVTTNNEVSTFVTVRAGGINVLYLVGAKRIGGGPGPEQRFVRAALAQSPDIVVERRLINYEPPGRRSGATAIRDGKSDVVILDDVDVQGLSPASWQAMAERVRAGHGPDDARRVPQLWAGRISRVAAGRRAADRTSGRRSGRSSASRCARMCSSPGRCGCGRPRRSGRGIRSCSWRASEVGGQRSGQATAADECLGAIAAAGWGESDRAERAEAECAGAGRGG